jgi:hypothetical protein
MRETPLPDVIQIVCQGGRSGHFTITHESNRAKIFIRDGRIVHAVTNKNQGLDAIYDVVTWSDGQYQFEERDLEASTPTSITKSNPIILMELGRRIDEWRVISQVIPSVALHPYSTVLPGESLTDLNPREQKLMEFVNGYYTVDELAMVMQKSVINVAKELYGLINHGYVSLKGVRAPRPPRAAVEAERRMVMGREDHTPFMLSGANPFSANSGSGEDPFTGTFRNEGTAGIVPVVVAPIQSSDSSRPAAGGGGAGDVMRHIDFIGRIRDIAKELLPVSAHDAVKDIHAKYSKGLMIGGADLNAVKQMAIEVSRAAVSAGCDSKTVITLNQELKKIFGKA